MALLPRDFFKRGEAENSRIFGDALGGRTNLWHALFYILEQLAHDHELTIEFGY